MSTILEPITAEALVEGHDRLLRTFREFAASFHPAEPCGAEDPAVLLGAVAFLRQSVAPFARREEDSPALPRMLLDDAAFEHAFIAAETEALASESAELLNTPAEQLQRRRTINHAVRRRVHRIEAVLELHVQKHEERIQEVGTEPPGRPGPTPGGPREMNASEVSRLLREHNWGMLCTVDGAEPYAVPISYGYDGEQVYIAIGQGMKARNIERNPLVCLTVAEVESGSRWCSVVISGEAVPLTSMIEKMRALHALARQQSRLPSSGDLARMTSARVFRIEPSRITGRFRG